MQLYQDSRWFVLRVRQLSTLVSAGVSLTHAIDVLASDDGKYRTLWQVTRSELNHGVPPLIALRHIVPGPLRTVLDDLDHVPDLALFLNHLADWIEHRLNRLQHLGRQMIYPLLLVGALCGVGVVMVTQVLPQYVNLLPQGQTPPLGLRVALLASSALDHPNSGWVVMLGIAGVAGILARLVFLGISYFLGPRFRLHDGFILLAAYLRCGVPLNQAMMTLSKQSVSGVAWKPFCDGVLESGEFSEAASVFLRLTAFHSEMIRIGQHTGQLEEMLRHVSIALQQEDDRRLDQRMALIQPILYLVIGVMILGAAYMTLAPMSAILMT